MNAVAGSATVYLQRASLDNDTDTAGIWQYEGGTLLSTSGASIGTYIVTRRVTTSGTSTYNTASETISLFLPPVVANSVPSVITIEGAHSYNTGAFAGSVSAASNKYTWIAGADVSGTVATTATQTKLVIIWNGSNALHVP
jgi:hypothetical protein